jgi:predicted alternative tryptophan synthase beta-subunit
MADHDCPLGMTPASMQDLVVDQGKQTAKLEHIVETVNEIKSCLKGNGKPGLIIRTDRLEQKEKTKARIFWVIFAATIALVVRAVSPAFGSFFNFKF